MELGNVALGSCTVQQYRDRPMPVGGSSLLRYWRMGIAELEDDELDRWYKLLCMPDSPITLDNATQRKVCEEEFIRRKELLEWAQHS